MTVIDVHTHYVPRGWPDLSELAPNEEAWPRLRLESEREAMIMLGSEPFRRITSECWDADARLEQMAADGVDQQVVSPTPLFFSYDRPPETAAAIARIFNDLALQVCAPHPDRLLPFCQVPLQDAEAACEEVDRCVEAGHLGVEIGNHVGDRDLDDAGIVMFLQHCAANDVPVFVHPWDMRTSPREDRWMARWLVGMPAETHLSLLAMVLGGVFDRVSPELRICFAHGGGSFAFWLGRLENAWYRRPDLIAASKLPPSHYVGRFMVDSVVFDPAPLRLLVDTLGDDAVMLGSDFPYPLGERPVGRVVREAEWLAPPERANILGANARRFIGPRLDSRCHGIPLA